MNNPTPPAPRKPQLVCPAGSLRALQLALQAGVPLIYPRHEAKSFGTRRQMPVYVEESVLALPRILINGGRRGYLVGLTPDVCVQLLNARAVQCALAE